MWIASDAGELELVEILLKMAKRNQTLPLRPQTSKDGTSPLEIAGVQGHARVVEKLKECMEQTFPKTLFVLSRTYPQYNEKAVEESGAKIKERYF